MLIPLIVLLSSSGSAHGPRPPEESQSVWRVHDIGASLPVATQEANPTILLPILRDFGAFHPDSGYWGAPGNPDAVLEFLRALDPPQWEYEKREIQCEGGRQLRVLAPSSLQDVVARTLAFLGETVAKPTTLVVDLVSFGPNPGVASLPPLLPSSEVSRWTALGTGHESYTLEIRPGQRITQRAERSVSFVTGAQTEVAERASAHSVTPERVSIGTLIEMAVAPGRGGLWTALTLRHGRFLNVDATKETTNGVVITHDQAVAAIEGPRLRSDPRVANHSLAVNAFLPDGKALAWVTSAGLESRVVFLRQTSTPPPPIVSLPAELQRVTSRGATTLVRTDGVNVPTVRASGVEGEDGLSPLAILADPGAAESTPLVQTRLDTDWRVAAIDFLRPMIEGSDLVELGPFVAVCGPSREPIEAAIAQFTALAPDAQSVCATLSLRRGTRDTNTLARAVVPMRVGYPSTVVLGRESLLDSQANVEIAQGTASRQTVVSRMFDGLTVVIVPVATPAGDLTLELDAHARWSRGQPRAHDAGGLLPARVELPDADVLDLRRAVSIAKGASPRKAVLGNAGTSEEALTLEIEVVDLR